MSNESDNADRSQSAFERLPAEIAIEIFRLSSVLDPFPVASPHTAPLLLGTVSHSWRTLAYTTPHLWSGLTLKWPRAGTTLEQRPRRPAANSSMVQGIRDWLMRTNASPLQLCLDFTTITIAEFLTAEDPPRPGGAALQAMNEIVSLMATYRLLWQSVQFMVPPQCMPALLHTLKDGAPLVQSVEVGFSHPSQSRGTYSIPVDLTSCPQVDTLTLLHHGSGHLRPRIDADVGANMLVMRLRLDWLREECLTLLDLCPNLERLEIMSAHGEMPVTRTSPCALPSLRKLLIKSHDGDETLLDWLNVPGLRIFSLQGLMHWPIDSIQSLQTCLEKNGTGLKQLHLAYINIPESTLMSLLSLVPNINHLSLIHLKLTDGIVRRMTWHDADTRTRDPLCPSLTHISVAVSPPLLAPSADLIAAMITSRWDGIAAEHRLQEVVCNPPLCDLLRGMPQILNSTREGLMLRSMDSLIGQD